MTPTAARNAEVAFVANREARPFPKGWRHPVDERNRYVPLLPYGSDNQTASPQTTMPATPWRGEAEIAAYETTSEGTPISPSFPNSPEGRLALVAYCTAHCTLWGDHKAGPEAWAVILFGEGAAVTSNGVVVASDN